jgi:hypothetical protein
MPKTSRVVAVDACQKFDVLGEEVGMRRKILKKSSHCCLDFLPVELLSSMLEFLLLEEVTEVSHCSMTLLDHCRRQYIPSVKEFCLKQQCGRINALPYLMKYSARLSYIFLDARGSSCKYGMKPLITEATKQTHGASLSQLTVLIIRSCTFMSNLLITQLFQHCKQVRTLGKHNSIEVVQNNL